PLRYRRDDGNKNHHYYTIVGSKHWDEEWRDSIRALGGTSMSTIMITGGSGFLGTYVAQRLAERGDQVVIFDAVGPIPELAALTGLYENRIVRVRGQVVD